MQESLYAIDQEENRTAAQRATISATARRSRLHKPDHLTLEAWQAALRKQFGLEQKFKLENVGGHAVFSDFQVTNPQSKQTYRVVIRGGGLADNICSCPDFATNTLGTCKHIEFTLAKLRRRAGAKAALRERFRPSYSEVCLRYGAQREVRVRLAEERPAPLDRLVKDFLTPAAYFVQKLLRDSNTFSPHPEKSILNCAAMRMCSASLPRCATGIIGAGGWSGRIPKESAVPA